MGPRLSGLNAEAIRHVVASAQALEMARADEAERVLAPVLAANPNHPEVLRLHAGMLSLRGDHANAFNAMKRAVDQRPDDALYHNTMGTIFAAAGDLDAAVDALRFACDLQPTLATGWYNLGILLIRSVRYDEAAEVLKRVVTLAPDHMEARAQLADMLKGSGNAEEAAKEYRNVLAQRPGTGMAWWGLADIKTTKLSAVDVARMRAVLKNDDARDDDKIAIGFALAKALDDQGQYAESLDALANANVIARRQKIWDAKAFSAKVDEINVAHRSLTNVASGNAGHEVIFITGLPRSGSTLVEQILASHSQVEGAGELLDLQQVLSEESQRRLVPFPQWASAMVADDWQRLGHEYLQRTARWRKRRLVFTDKLPGNWMYIGAIRAMLPGAHVICCRRDRLETCLACYRQNMLGNAYTRTFEDLASYWRDYDRSAKLWSRIDPAHVYEHSYENLVANPETGIRKLLDFLGLPFEEACLNFHETVRDVRSPSAMQVRQPLRKDTARAPRYGALLDPLRASLGMPPYAS